ncbi:MAG: hypothetical protein CSB47_11235 [Proteobacteria bacterium]|nr:MAG: hypothetical protein CSB47_11235 [Pseudomonadota bacterium]
MLPQQLVQPLNSLPKNTQPDSSAEQVEPLLVITCGALAREIQQIKLLNDWRHIRIQCLDAELHNHPKLIAGKLREKLTLLRDDYENIFIAYADCGTGGDIDRVIAEFSHVDSPIERLPGAHCYAFFAGLETFDELAEEAIGTFYLTDFLAQHFDRLIIRGMKLDQHPELKPMMFGHYTRLMYLSQTHNEKLKNAAQQAADYLGLAFETRHTGYGLLESGLQAQVINFQP